ncbi:MAG: hypothetical protein V4601_02035 [Pseudomonadota bacterium]
MSSSDTPAKLPLLKELELVAKQSWRLIVGCMGIGFIIAALSLQGAVYSYPVQMQVTMAQAATSGGFGGSGGRMQQLSGLAGLAGVSMPATQNEMQFQLFVDSIFSRDLADDIAKNQDIMIAMYRGQWNPDTGTWQEPPAPMSAGIKNWIRGILGLAPPTPWHAPNGQNLQSFLADSLDVRVDPRKTYLATLTLTTGDRDLSIRFLDLLVKTADNRLRQKALERARIYIQYLTAKLNTVTVAEHREALTQALGEQERYAMVASADKPFAAEVFQSPWSSNLPKSPSPRQVYALWVILGAFAGLGFALMRRRHQSYLQRANWVQRLPGVIRRQLTAGFSPAA